MKKICDDMNLVLDDTGNVVRVPFLVKGRIVAPPEMKSDEVRDAFIDVPEDGTYVKLDNAQLLREPVIDRKTQKLTGEYMYQVMPALSPLELIENDFDKLVKGLYSIPFSEVLRFLQSLIDILSEEKDVLGRIHEIYLKTAEHPDAYQDASFAGFPFLLDPKIAKSMVDNELSAWGRPGSEFLDGWVEVQADVIAGIASMMAERLFSDEKKYSVEPAGALIRAMPTRQLHITAGNAPAIPILSALRAILIKSAAVIKSPYGATLPAALLALAAASAAPDHPITQNLSIVYWQGGDGSVENAFFMPGAFDRIVVWGAPDAVASVQSRALFTRTVCFNPRYGISMIGREVFSDDIEKVAVRASTDTMIWNQKACIASQVHYVEGSEEQAKSYAEALREILGGKWDSLAPQYVRPEFKGALKRMRRGKYMNASWHLNQRDGEFLSGVVMMPGEFDILDHPMCRLVVVRRVDDLRDVLKYLHHAVSTVGVYPEKRRFELRDAILARGVSNVFPLGQAERMFAGMPHDGMFPLSDLVDWKNG